MTQETKSFVTSSRVLHNGKTVEAGNDVDLTQDEFAALKAGGAVLGDWDSKPESKPAAK